MYVQGDHAGEIDLTEERVGTMVESRLRAARLYTSRDGVPFLEVNILALGTHGRDAGFIMQGLSEDLD